MAPTLSQINDQALQPLLNGKMTYTQAYDAAQKPLRVFMLDQTRTPELNLFVKASGDPAPTTRNDVPMSTLIPAFILSELKTAFIIGFVIFIPFLIIDLVVSVDADVDGHVHASTRTRVVAVQADAVRHGRRLGARRELAAHELPPLATVRSTSHDRQLGYRHRSAVDSARDQTRGAGTWRLVCVGLFVGLFQSATQIQEQTLAFVPKLAAVAITLVICGHWMLDQMISFTTRPLGDDPAPDPVTTFTRMQFTVDPAILIAFSLALVRAAAWLFVSPPFNTRMIPTVVKVGIAAALAACAAPHIATPNAISLDTTVSSSRWLPKRSWGSRSGC